ncbi:hypothetical protein N431DRAFT_494394 [Stipitochalara longipes BDJ]|nr:hypothetical protein N431DRAFT_494394 [Stipitochalara longipes BDJ]
MAEGFLRNVFLVLFHAAHVGAFVLGWYLQETNTKLAALNALSYSVWISRGSALCLSIDATLILLPMCKVFIRWTRPRVKFVPADESVWFHRQVAYSMLFWTVSHVVGHYVNFLHIEIWKLRPETAIQIHFTQAGGITGHFMLLCMLFIYTSAHSKFRMKSFDIFKLTHNLFIPFLLALYTHATGCFVRDTTAPFSPFAGANFFGHCIGYQSWRWELGAAGLYLFDRIYRAIQAKDELRLLSGGRYPCNIVELRFEKSQFKYEAGQWLLINIPEVNRTQWHPFTISSCPFDDYVAVHINQSGDWTTEMAKLLGLDVVCGSPIIRRRKPPTVRMDGPFGAPADVSGNDIAILIGAGIGATPWMSVLRNIYHQRAQMQLSTALHRIEFIWICKNDASLKLFHDFLASLKMKAHPILPGIDSSWFLQIHLYLTQVSQLSDEITEAIGQDSFAPTGVRYQVNFGRPNFEYIFDNIKHKIGSNIGNMIAKRASIVSSNRASIISLGGKRKKVGVYFCGSEVIAKDISAATLAATSRDITFTFSNKRYL